MLKKFDIPTNITVTANDETQAEKYVLEFLSTSFKEFGATYNVRDFEYFEFVTKESSCCGCGDKHCQ